MIGLIQLRGLHKLNLVKPGHCSLVLKVMLTSSTPSLQGQDTGPHTLGLPPASEGNQGQLFLKGPQGWSSVGGWVILPLSVLTIANPTPAQQDAVICLWDWIKPPLPG